VKKRIVDECKTFQLCVLNQTSFQGKDYYHFCRDRKQNPNPFFINPINPITMSQPFSAYHGVSANAHQTNFNNLSKDGFRMISLSVYGTPASAQYAAVWVKRSGAAYVATHGIDGAAYQAFFNTWSAKGYVPVLLSATGSRSNAIFAAVFEKRNYNAWVAKHDMTQAAFDAENDKAKKNNLILKTCTTYGSVADRRYAAVWIPNPGFIKWRVYSNISDTDYQTQFNANTQLPFYCPEIVAVSDEQTYCCMFTDSIRGRFEARHGLTAAQYQKEFDKHTKAGLMPVYVDGGGNGNSTRYSVVFAETDIPFARNWTISGTGTTATKGLDKIMKDFMLEHGIRYAQLSLGRNGTSKYNKAYTWAESNYKIAQPSDKFMLASCSKLYLTAAVKTLLDDPKFNLAPGDKAYAKLGYSNPKDPKSDDITIQNLLDHKGGFDADTYDATYDMRDIATSQNLGRAANKNDLATYMYKKRNLKDKPGTKDNYSNYGYVLLSLIIEKLTGKTYWDYLKKEVLDKINVTEVKVWPTVSATRAADEVVTESSGLGLSALNINSSLQVPSVYGGDGMIKEVAAASCGMASSANAMVQTIRHHAVWGTGGRMAGAARSGSTPGSSTLAVSNGDGMDWAYTINTREFVNPDSKPLEKLGADITKFLADNKSTI
jgi:CubicO group peptidase (beta-lactamase class C family)